jgi:ribonuclease HI
MNSQITIFTDGSSSGNPGPGGWGAIVKNHEKVMELGGRETHTTNNRMELMAVIEALGSIGSTKGEVIVHTDSSYVIQGITKWVKGWMARGWITSTKDEVQNRDLWENLHEKATKREAHGPIIWKQIEGHAGVPGNERADVIATSFTQNNPVELFAGDASDYSIDLSVIIANRTKKTVKEVAKDRSKKPAHSYISMINGDIQIHKTWKECEARVKGARGAKFKKSLSAADEKTIISEFKKL